MLIKKKNYFLFYNFTVKDIFFLRLTRHDSDALFSNTLLRTDSMPVINVEI